MLKRVVITGIGVISSLGIGKEKFWDNLIQGRSGISKISSFDTTDFPRHYGGEVKDFTGSEKMGRASSLAVSAARLGLEDAGLKSAALDKNKAGVVMGTTMAESGILGILNSAWIKNGPSAIDPELVCQYPANVLSVNIAKDLGFNGPNYLIPTACAAGNYAIGYAFDLLRNNEAEVVLAGGADAFSKLAFIGFNRLLAIAPERCQPFDKNRKGMLVGEGAAVVVLEPLERALARNANIYAEVLGYGLSCDAFHMTAPEAHGIAAAIEKSMKEANIRPEEVDYISAHGTGTPTNDKVEAQAINLVFKEHTPNVPVSSIKSMLGHTMGAASAIEAAACCLSIKHDIMPPTINYETPDPECNIDCVPNTARKKKLNLVLNTASAFGGNNACLVLAKPRAH